jgi:hypothetical protein
MLANAPLSFSGIASKENSDRVKLRPPKAAAQLSGWFVPVSPRTCHRAAIPCRNSSGNVASDAFGSMLLKKAKMNRSKFLPVYASKPLFRNPRHHRDLAKAAD